jgi:hypothetical protein
MMSSSSTSGVHANLRASEESTKERAGVTRERRES